MRTEKWVFNTMCVRKGGCFDLPEGSKVVGAAYVFFGVKKT